MIKRFNRVTQWLHRKDVTEKVLIMLDETETTIELDGRLAQIDH